MLPAGSEFAGLTAAMLFELWLPPLPAWLPVIAGLPPGADRPERAGLYVFRSRAGLPPAFELDGVPVTAPAVCLGQLAEDLAVADLVVAIDGAVQRGLCTVDDIYAAVRARQRGLPRLRRALELVDGRSESRWESYLRLMHVSAGIRVRPQKLIVDEQGRFVARADLWIEGTSRLPEFDGAHHRVREQHQEDLRREKQLARLGWERYGYVASEVMHRPERIIDDAEAALGLPHDPRRMVAWITIAQQSVLTRDGRFRLLRRLHRFNRPLRGRAARP